MRMRAKVENGHASTTNEAIERTGGWDVGNFKKLQHLNGSSQVFPQKVAKLNEKSN